MSASFDRDKIQAYISDNHSLDELVARFVATLKAVKQREKDFLHHPAYQQYIEKAKQRGKLPTAVSSVIDQETKLAQTTFLQPSFISKLR